MFRMLSCGWWKMMSVINLKGLSAGGDCAHATVSGREARVSGQCGSWPFRHGLCWFEGR
jgi:hypothetical protein